jgi:hypothetical protein
VIRHGSLARGVRRHRWRLITEALLMSGREPGGHSFVSYDGRSVTTPSEVHPPVDPETC